MKTQKQDIKRCQEHATSAGGDINLTVSHVSQSEAVSGAKTPVSLSTHDNTATGVSENTHPGRGFQKCSVSVSWYCVLRVDERPNRVKKVTVIKIPVSVWTKGNPSTGS